MGGQLEAATGAASTESEADSTCWHAADSGGLLGAEIGGDTAAAAAPATPNIDRTCWPTTGAGRAVGDELGGATAAALSGIASLCCRTSDSGRVVRGDLGEVKISARAERRAT